MRTPHTHGGTDAPECTTCRAAPILTRENREQWRKDYEDWVDLSDMYTSEAAERGLALLDSLDTAERDALMWQQRSLHNLYSAAEGWAKYDGLAQHMRALADKWEAGANWNPGGRSRLGCVADLRAELERLEA